MSFLRSWGYANERPITSYQEQRLNELVDRYHAVQKINFVDELDVTRCILGKELPFSELNVAEANRVAAELNVRVALYTHFKTHLPKKPLPFDQETDWLSADRPLLNRVIARAGWDTGEYFMSPHPLDKTGNR